MHYPVVTEEEFPYGLRCDSCGRELLPGQPCKDRLEDFIDAVPLTVITCVYC